MGHVKRSIGGARQLRSSAELEKWRKLSWPFVSVILPYSLIQTIFCYTSLFFFLHAHLVESFEQNCRRAQAFSLVAVVGDNSTDTEDDARWTRGPRALMATDGWVGGIRTGSAGGRATTKTGRGIAARDAARTPVSLNSFAPVHVTPLAESVRSFACMTSPQFWIDLLSFSIWIRRRATPWQLRWSKHTKPHTSNTWSWYGDSVRVAYKGPLHVNAT